MPRFGLCRAVPHNLFFSEKTGAACRHNSERFQEGEQLISRSVSSASAVDRLCQRHRSFLPLYMAVDVDLRRLARFMAQPKLDNRSIHTTLQKPPSG